VSVLFAHNQSLFAAAAASATVASDSEFERLPTRIVEIITAGFSGTLNIKGGIDRDQTPDNVVYVLLGSVGATPSAAALSWTTDTGRYRYLTTDPVPYLSFVMTRTAGSVTMSVEGYGELRPALGEG